MADEGRGVHLPGEIEGQSEVFTMWLGSGGGVSGGASAETAWGGSGRDKAVVDPSPIWRATDI